MAHVAYKVKIYNAAGTSLLGGKILRIPMAKSDGTMTGGSLARQTSAQVLCDALNLWSTANTIIDPDCDLLVGPGYNGGDPGEMTRLGFNNVLNPVLWATAGGIRLVFSNGSYMIATATELSTNQTCTFAYYKSDDTLVGSCTVRAGRVNVTTTGDYWNNCQTIPLPICNQELTITDWNPRYASIAIERYRNAYYCTISGSTKNLDGTTLDLREWYLGIETADENDPYIDLEDSEPSGPAAGEGIPDTDAVDIPDLPTVSVVDTGFVTLFNPTLAQVKDLAQYMWAGLFDLNTFKKIFADPMDCILGFNMLPVAIPDGGTGSVVVGNISTGVSMTKAAGQWIEVDCGTLSVPEPYGCYLDWAPYTKISLMLPYIGTVELSTDDVMGRTLSLKYHVDVLSCSCVAYLKCGSDVLYQFTGSCGYSIPVTGDNFRQMISNIVSIATVIGGAAASGGLTAPIGAAAAIKGAESCTQNVMNAKPEVHRSGSLGASAGIMGIQKPYLIMEMPKACKPKNQYHYLGYPSFVTVGLSGISGYAEFDSVILSGIACTETERRMIEDICKGGIYL